MSELLPVKENMEVEEMQAEAAASEGTMSKVGKNINFMNTFYAGPRQFKANGFYNDGNIPDTKIDGPVSLEADAEIFLLSAWNFTAGVSGTTEFDIICHPANGDPSYSIFTTTPKIPSSADHSPFASMIQRVIDGVTETLFQSTGTTLAVFITPNEFKRGDRFTMSLLDKQVSAIDCGIEISFRPRTETP